MSTLRISGKAIGARKPLFADWSIPFPPEWSDGGGLTLRDLIGRVVRAEVDAFRQRQDRRQVVRALTDREISSGVEKGKIDMGGSETPPQNVDEEEAATVACQAFEDGMYLVVIDGEEYRDIDREVHLKSDSHVAFVRLTLLAGG